ncbi:hypothetical protein R1sor_024116 [Riccia sorocarpa]|uniref:C2H2-type domain-containing protein n=1 Tax=Riccia sorocarpa TaxID=122646 RepID=A0ABD3GSU5_9MARC
MAAFVNHGKRRWMTLLLLVVIAVQTTLCGSAVLDRRPVYDGRKIEREAEEGKVHCSRSRSRTAHKIIDEYLLPFVQQKSYNLSSACRLNPENDMFKDQELKKDMIRVSQWRCDYCKKTFRSEDYLDNHMDNRHLDLLDLSANRCLADVCGAIHCDHVASQGKAGAKKRCNRAAVIKNKHLCESLASSCFPPEDGAVALQLNEFFLRQFCDSHTCDGTPKHFPRGSGVRKNKSLFMAVCLFTIILLLIFYLAVYLYKKDMNISAARLKHLRQHSILKAQKSKKY